MGFAWERMVFGGNYGIGFPAGDNFSCFSIADFGFSCSGGYYGIPLSQHVDGEALAEAFTSWYLPGFLFLCLLASLLLIWIINWGRIRNAFLAVGISALLAGFFSVTIGIASRSLLGLLPGVYQSQLLGAADVYRELAFAFSLVLTVVGVFFLSVYADIVILRRNKG